jgi:hypothetical protein
MSNVWGMHFMGITRSNGPAIKVQNNIGYNLRNNPYGSHFVQFDNGSFPGSDISDNFVLNEPGQSNVEDVISMYNALGTPTAHISIHNNVVFGAYPVNPATDNYSGGGIIVDGDLTQPAATSSSYIDIYNNFVANTTNYGIAIASGNNNTLTNNIVYASGFTGSGTPIKAQNVGIYVWDGANRGPSIFFNNAAYQNTVYWLKISSTAPFTASLNDWWLPNCSTATVTNGCTNLAVWAAATIAGATAVGAPYLQEFLGGS